MDEPRSRTPREYASEFATLRELDDVKQDLREVRGSIQIMDANGTRGVVGLQASMTDLIKDLTELKAAFQNWTNGHENRHEKELRDRIIGRRWFIGSFISALIALGGMYGFLSVILSHLHK